MCPPRISPLGIPPRKPIWVGLSGGGGYLLGWCVLTHELENGPVGNAMIFGVSFVLVLRVMSCVLVSLQTSVISGREGGGEGANTSHPVAAHGYAYQPSPIAQKGGRVVCCLVLSFPSLIQIGR